MKVLTTMQADEVPDIKARSKYDSLIRTVRELKVGSALKIEMDTANQHYTIKSNIAKHYPSMKFDFRKTKENAKDIFYIIRQK